MRRARPGYGLARELARREVQCVVAAPSKIPRGSGERVKTDRRDAELLARLLLAGKLHPVRVPGREEEALRDLIRAREAVRVDLMRCRHRLSKLLLRHGIRFEDGDAWTTRHQQWLSTITLAQPAAQATLLDRAARSMRRCTAASSSSGRSSRCCPALRGACRSAGCGACEGSTRSPRSDCAPRSATSPASASPRS